MVDLASMDPKYLAGFGDTLNQVIAEVFGVPLMVAGGIHAREMFGADMISAAAIAGCQSGFSIDEAVAALSYLIFHMFDKRTTKFQRLTNKNLRRLYSDLKLLHTNTYSLVKNHVDNQSKEFEVFSKMILANL